MDKINTSTIFEKQNEMDYYDIDLRVPDKRMLDAQLLLLIPRPESYTRCLCSPTGLPILPNLKESVVEGRVPRALDNSIRQAGLHKHHLEFHPLKRFVCQPHLGRAAIWGLVNVKITKFGFDLGRWTADQRLRGARPPHSLSLSRGRLEGTRNAKNLEAFIMFVEQTRGQRQTGRNDLPSRVREVA